MHFLTCLLQVLLQKLGAPNHLRFELNDDVVLNNKRDGCREMALYESGADDGACEPILPSTPVMTSSHYYLATCFIIRCTNHSVR